MKKRTPKQDAIKILIKQWDTSTDKELALQLGWSQHTIQSWAKRLKKEGVKLIDRRKKSFEWKKYAK